MAAYLDGVAVPFSELAMVRGQSSFNLFDQYRVDLFLDQALGFTGRIPTTPPGSRNESYRT